MKRPENNIAIQLTNVSKKYEIHHEKPTLVEKFVKGKNETFWALKSINLTITKGERIGIIGPNGSGKTTLLKIISGITTPTTGNVNISGKIASLIDLEAGFHDDLTGYQNIFLNGLLLGMKRSDIENKIRLIIAYAEINQFIDAPLFTYSSGMKLKLGFSIIIHSPFDILVMDESFGVGDERFQNKAYKTVIDLEKSKKTLLLATHWIDLFKYTRCNRILVFKNNTVFKDGSIQITKEYQKDVLDT